MYILKKASKDLNCKIENETYLNISSSTKEKVKEWLNNNNFIESKVRKNRWIKNGCELILDDIRNFLYEPTL